MARKISSRLKISGNLVAAGPLHIGGADGNADVDLALALNGQGKLYVPGTSLAGPLRAWLRERIGEAEVRKSWGYQEQKPDEFEPQGHASLILIEDGLVTLPAGATIETRDGVGIDRISGAAAEHAKYNRAVLPNGSEISFEMTVELKDENDPARGWMLAALQALQHGEIRFGAAKTRGLGKVALQNLKIYEQKLNRFDGMLAALRGDGGLLSEEDLKAADLPGRPMLRIKIDWKPRGPLMVKAERDGVSVDMLPLVSAVGRELTFVLPGSSIKGALRNQAERIVRTVCRKAAPEIDNPREAFLRQVDLMEFEDEDDEAKDRSLIGALFGAAGKSKQQELPDDGPPVLGLSAVTVEDCYAVPRFSPKQWNAIENAMDLDEDGFKKDSVAPLLNALNDAGLSKMQQAFHVAVDRWTGGAADGFLYTVLEPHGVEWEPMYLSLDLARIREEERLPAVMCLLLTLRDMVNGRIPLGYATNRGMGALEITGVEISTANLNEELDDLKNIRLINGKLTGWSDALKNNLESAWTGWRTANQAGGKKQ